MKSTVTRRAFMGRSAVAAMGIGLAARAVGGEGQAAPADTISMGFIGVGSMGGGDLKAFAGHRDVRVSAICDVNVPRREAVVKRFAATAKGYHDFRKLLEQKDIDAVCIATPPHWHAIIAVHAAKAGKDFYVEKPMTLYVAESQAVVRAATENKRVTQVGTQIHAGGNYRRVVEIVRGGVLGPVNVVRTFNVMNQTRAGIGKAPANVPVPQGLDWDMFLGPLPMRPFNPIIVASAYQHCSFMDISGGWLPGMAPHIIDLPIWALDLPLPSQVSCAGGRFIIDDCGDAPEVQECLFRYPTCVMTWMHNLANSYGFDFQGKGGMARRLGIYFHGEKATLHTDYGTHTIVAEAGPKATLELPGPSLPPLAEHHRQLVDAVKSRQQPSCNVAYHHRVNVPICLANLSYKVGRSVQFDPVKEAVIGDEQAARLLAPTYREPWTLG
ncbi:MAG TPA: Gfo/Idh/MocA family oxidoreductase [Planctomycetota bacterium]|nr:Gfo/Idh/MocA family oxidoreductase [Planctomycetota bacterium]